MNSPETEILHKFSDDFLSSNANYFVQAFAKLNEIFEQSGQIHIISQEKKFTVAVGMKIMKGSEELDVECVLLKPNQSSLRDCINIIAQ